MEVARIPVLALLVRLSPAEDLVQAPVLIIPDLARLTVFGAGVGVLFEAVPFKLLSVKENQPFLTFYYIG